MQRADFQQLAADRLADAEGLLALGRWAGAYYLAGYAVECGLKACVLANLLTDPGVVFRNRRFSDQCWTHKASERVRLAGLEDALDAAKLADPDFGRNWLLVTQWSEASRYHGRDEPTARKYLDALTDPTSGVLPWIRRFW